MVAPIFLCCTAHRCPQNVRKTERSVRKNVRRRVYDCGHPHCETLYFCKLPNRKDFTSVNHWTSLQNLQFWTAKGCFRFTSSTTSGDCGGITWNTVRSSWRVSVSRFPRAYSSAVVSSVQDRYRPSPSNGYQWEVHGIGFPIPSPLIYLSG